MFTAVLAILKREIPSQSTLFREIHAVLPVILQTAKAKANGRSTFPYLLPSFLRLSHLRSYTGDYLRELHKTKMNLVQTPDFVSFSEIKAQVVSKGFARSHTHTHTHTDTHTHSPSLAFFFFQIFPSR